MKILILMAGRGKRFNNFLSPKPLIELDGKPMIEHVVDYFPRNSEFIFVCNETHLKTTNIKNILKRIAPNCRIIGIADEMLKGPAYSSFAAFEFIGDNEEVIVNYCDFIQEWDYNDFYNTINKEKPHGAIISFRGFHPSSLGDTYYAYMKVNEDGYVTALKEKESFSEDRTQDYGSTGTYYFATGELFKKYVKKLVSSPTNAVNGEFYMSLPYLFMIDDGLRKLNYEAKKFICLGTPRDYELYKFWSEFFLQYTPKFISFDNVNLKVKNIFPLAGGERDFKEVGLNNLNFMVPVMNKPMLHYALYSCPGAVKNIFISLEEHKNEFHEKILPETTRYNSEIVYLKNKTSSNAETILKVQDKIPKDHSVCFRMHLYF